MVLAMVGVGLIGGPAAGVPALRARDVAGRVRTLAEFRGRPVALFFFCGCRWCQECGPILAGLQRRPLARSKRAPVTVVAYAGDPEQSRRFAQRHRLVRETVLLPDRKFQLAQAFGAVPCPRAFALDRHGKLLYTNTRPDDAAQKGSPKLLMSRAWSAVSQEKPSSGLPSPAGATLRAGKLAVAPAPGIELVGTTTGRARFEAVDELDAQPVTREFRVRNASGAAFRIAKVEASCGCSRVRVQPEGEAEFDPAAAGRSISLAPGEELRVRFTVDLAEVASGAVDKYVWLYPPGSRKPAATLEIQGTVRPAVVYRPEFLDFGEVRAGSSRTLEVAVQIDRRLAGAEAPPALLSPVPEIRVGKPVVTGDEFRYQVTLERHAPIGVLPDALRLREAPGALLEGRPHRVLAGSVVSLLGKVVGEVRAEPELVVLGEVRAGRQGVQKVTLTAEKPGVWRGTTAASASRWIHARLALGAGGRRRVLEIRLRPEAPAGRLSTTVEVRLRNGRRLVVPFEVDVLRGSQEGWHPGQ